jgi:hypothetical protein
MPSVHCGGLRLARTTRLLAKAAAAAGHRIKVFMDCFVLQFSGMISTPHVGSQQRGDDSSNSGSISSAGCCILQRPRVATVLSITATPPQNDDSSSCHAFNRVGNEINNNILMMICAMLRFVSRFVIHRVIPPPSFEQTLANSTCRYHYIIQYVYVRNSGISDAQFVDRGIYLQDESINKTRQGSSDARYDAGCVVTANQDVSAMLCTRGRDSLCSIQKDNCRPNTT